MVLGVDDPFAVAAALMFAAATLWGFRQTRRRKAAVDPTETGDAATIRAGEYATVRGTVRLPAGGDPLTSPVRRRDCALAAWAIDDYLGHEWAPGGGWTTQIERCEAVPFLVDDGTGRVQVSLDGGHDVSDTDVWIELAGYDEAIEEVGPDESAPDHLRDLVESRDDVVDDRQLLVDFEYPHGYRRFREVRLQPGDEVYVAGQAVPATGTGGAGGPSVAIRRPDDRELRPFVLTDGDEAELARHTAHVSWILLAVGVGLVLWVVNELTVGILPLLRLFG